MTALLHDMGKARVPVEILNKTTGLDEREWRVMQAHPWLGALTLFTLRSYDETPYRAILTAHEHHMKTDLSGYPRTVRPRDLGIFSRIVAVADGFDAATTRRSYQTVPIEPDQVLREMWQNPKRGYDAHPGKGADQPDRHLPGGDLRDSRHLRGGGRRRARSRGPAAQPPGRAHCGGGGGGSGAAAGHSWSASPSGTRRAPTAAPSSRSPTLRATVSRSATTLSDSLITRTFADLRAARPHRADPLSHRRLS